MNPAIHFRGVVLGPSGFAAEGREWLWALDAAGLAPSLEGASLGDLAHEPTADERALIERCAGRPRRRGGITFHHLPVPHFRPDPRADADWLCTVFETDGLPEGWAERAAAAAVVLVRTAWARDVFARCGVPAEKLSVLPPPFDPHGFAPAPRAPRRVAAPFRWLSVFDWTLRKGWDLLLPAFARTFGKGQAELVLKVVPQAGVTPEQIAALCVREVARHAGGAPPCVRVISEVLDRDRLASLYASADAFVLPSRGEGWGRPVHEAMLMELPVVATAASALATLLPDDRTGFPVRAHRARVPEVAARETPWYRGQTWFEPDPAELALRMREVFEQPAAAALRGRTARLHVLELCDRARVASALRALLCGAAPLQQPA